MARPSKLSPEQCTRILLLREEGVSGPTLAKRFHISASSLYKILNGTYVAGPSDRAEHPSVAASESKGATPSLFIKAQPLSEIERDPQEQQLSSRVIRAADAALFQHIDEVTLAAAELIVAQAKYFQIRKQKS